MFSGNKNNSGRKKIKPLYLAEGGFSLTPPGSSFGGTSTSSKTKTTVPFPKTPAEYMKTIGANPKYKNLDSSKILQLYSKDKSTWPKSLDIIEENCSEPGKCGKTLKYSISPTAPIYNWGSKGSTTTVKPKTTTSTNITPVSTATKTTGTTPISTPTVIPTNTPVVPPVAKTSVQTPIQTTAPGRPYLMQRFNYMTPEDRQRAVSFYGKIENVPTQGVDIYQLRRDVPKVPKVSTFQSGGTSCPEGKTWSAELNRCVSSYEANYVKGLKKDREDIIGLYRTGADKTIINARTEAFKQKYKKESGEPVQLFCDKYDCKIPPETFSSTTTTNTNTPSFNIKGIISDEYLPDPKNPKSREWRYRIETDKGFDILPSKKAFDEWKEKYKSAYQPYYEKSNRITPGSQNTVDYNKGRINEYLEKPTLKYEETPKLVKKRGGEIKNDRAMVSGVSSILKKIKDKDNRKEVAGDMVNQFNREGVSYNKEKFLKNSRSFAAGGPVKPYYTSNPNDPRFKKYADSLYAYETGESNIARAADIARGIKDKNNKRKSFFENSTNVLNYEIPKGGGVSGGVDAWLKKNTASGSRLGRDYVNIGTRGISPISTVYNIVPWPENPYNLFSNKKLPKTRDDLENSSDFKYFWLEGESRYKKPVQPVIYKPAPKKSTMTTMSKTPKTTTNKYVKTIIPTTVSTTTPSTPSTSITSTAPKTTPTTTVQTPKQLPANTPQMQRYNYMSTEDKKRAVQKYGDPSKVPTYVDLNVLRREVKDVKKSGGTISKKSQKAKLSQLYKTFKLKK
jgi:hypothetical protein